MKCAAILAGLMASLTATSPWALPFQSGPAAGEKHEIIVSYETSQQGSDGSSGSSRGSDALLERVIAITDIGLELEFDLPIGATAEDRARDWKYPARILQRPSGSMELLNRDELEKRVDIWLTTAEMTRDMCGRWIFTWNAFRIDCDPGSVIADIEAINLLTVDLREGGVYRHPETLRPGTLARTMDGPDGATYYVKLEIDADAVRRSRAESDVAVAEIMQQPLTLETALRERSKETVSGTVEVTFDVDVSGRPTRRTTVTLVKTVKPDGVSATDRQTTTVERRTISNTIS